MGKEDAGTGILFVGPRSITDGFVYKETIVLGSTDLTSLEIDVIVKAMGKERFSGRAYSFITNNCNDFTAAFAKKLCKSDIPTWINRPARLARLCWFYQTEEAKPTGEDTRNYSESVSRTITLEAAADDDDLSNAEHSLSTVGDDLSKSVVKL